MIPRKSKVLVRSARPEDVPQLVQLCVELGYPAMEEELASRLRRFDGATDRAVLVAETDGAVVGWLHVFAAEPLHSAASAEIGGLVVSPGFRRRGVARRLVAAATVWSASAGFCELRVRSNLQRQEAHRFYPALGFQRVKEQAIYARSLEPADRDPPPGAEGRHADRQPR